MYDSNQELSSTIAEGLSLEVLAFGGEPANSGLDCSFNSPAFVRLANPNHRRRAVAVWESLSLSFQYLVNSALTYPCVLQGYALAPSSVSGHHSHRGGNLQHSVEVAELVRTILPWFPDASHDIATAAALLHDIGKSLEYEEDKNGSVTGLSFRGRLIGHKLLTVQIVTVAMLEARLSLVERVGLIHAISAVPAPDWVGLRCPATPEAAVLSFADRISGKAHLIEKIAAPNGGWGQYHKHNGGRIFTVVDQRRNNRYGRNI